MFLKPANVIWLPSNNEWTLIDFGCASRTGADAPLSFSLWYAPPEVITAYKAGKHTLVADPSADVWALGVRAALPSKCYIKLSYCCKVRSLCTCRTCCERPQTRPPPPPIA